MLDFNHTAQLRRADQRLRRRSPDCRNAARPPRDYLGGSRLGHACERALQFEFTGAPKDEGQEFSGQLLRIFAIGHPLEDLAIRWLRGAGFDLYTAKATADGGQFGFSVAGGRIRGHVDGIIAAGPAGSRAARPGALGMQDDEREELARLRQGRRDVSKPVYAAQIAIYQAYMEAAVPGISAAPAVFTAINKDTAELHHELVPFDADLAQRMSDRAVRILQATDAGELLPRIAANRDFFECRFCAHAERCWSTA